MGAVGLAPEPAESPLVITGVLSWSSSSESETAMALKALGTEWLRKEEKKVRLATELIVLCDS